MGSIVRVHILDPAALATSSQALMSFWPYSDVRAGHVTSIGSIGSADIPYIPHIPHVPAITMGRSYIFKYTVSTIR